MAIIITLGVLILLAGAGFAGGIIGVIKASSSAPRKLSALVALIALVAIVGLSFGEVNAAKAYRAEKESEQQQADAESKEESDRQKAEEESKQAAEAESTGDETSNEETEEPEEDTEEPDWESMSADYLLDKPNMDNGAIRALEMTERDLHRFEEEYGKTYNGSSTNDMMIYRIAHTKDEYAFSNSILVNFADRWYFEENSDDLEYYYAVDSDNVDPDSKVFIKARAEMKEQYEDWEKEFRELKPENNDYEEYARNNFLQELLHNPQATIAWYELMSRHSVFTQNNPWIKENLERMHEVYKLDPEEEELVGTATFLTNSPDHKDDEQEEEHDYTHTELNDEMWAYACYGARMFELTDRTGFKNATSKVRWGLDIDDEYPDLTKPEIFDQKKDQVSGYFDMYQVKVDGKVVVSYGVHCSDNGLAEFDIAVQTTIITTQKTTPDYSLAVVYIEKATGVKIAPDFIYPEKLKAGAPYGPFTKEIADYTLLSTPAETQGFMPAADKIVTVYYKKNTPPITTDDPGGDPNPDKPKPTPEDDKPKDDKQDPENDPDNDQSRGDNDNKGDGEAETQKPPAQDTKPADDEQSGGGGSSGGSEGEGAHDSTSDKGDSNPATDTNDNGDKTTTDPGSEKNNGAVSSDDL